MLARLKRARLKGCERAQSAARKFLVTYLVHFNYRTAIGELFELVDDNSRDEMLSELMAAFKEALRSDVVQKNPETFYAITRVSERLKSRA